MLPLSVDKAAFDETLNAAKEALLSQQNEHGIWKGHLSSSALATATALCALAQLDQEKHRRLISQGLDWIAEHPNTDGGWGDTTLSQSNISATILCWAAFGAVAGADHKYREIVTRAESWLVSQAQGLEADLLLQALDQRYGRDRTFAAPIISMCVIAGRFDAESQPWRKVRALPFELAILPRSFYRLMRLEVVSYALPALIAIGQSRFHFAPPRNPLTRLLRHLTRKKTLRILERIQPTSGGYLEAITLTSFVLMNLTAIGRTSHPVVRQATQFLESTVRPDGSWPIDSNLSTWVTTLAVNALATESDFAGALPCHRRASIRRWLTDQQMQQVHPYTGAKPGGWAWTDAPGGVPDADDTAAALLALKNLAPQDQPPTKALEAGLSWLLQLQNHDGGIPTFCRGWQKMPFDRSGNDLTAHALAAWHAWQGRVSPRLQRRLAAAIHCAVTYLQNTQTPDGAWPALWFGNQHAPEEQNHTYGTARVLSALICLQDSPRANVRPMIAGGMDWLLRAQNNDGGWGGSLTLDHAMPSSVEETSPAVGALAQLSADQKSSPDKLAPSIKAGVNWLIDHTQQGQNITPSPIGFYFAKLWYFEELYTLIFMVGALQQVKTLGLAGQD